jgi:hypothetical protein
MKVFLAFFFFFSFFAPNVFVPAHRSDWYGNEVMRGTSDLDAARDSVVSLLRGAISDRGCAIMLLRGREVAVVISKVHRSFGRAKTD